MKTAEAEAGCAARSDVLARAVSFSDNEIVLRQRDRSQTTPNFCELCWLAKNTKLSRYSNMVYNASLGGRQFQCWQITVAICMQGPFIKTFCANLHVKSSCYNTWTKISSNIYHQEFLHAGICQWGLINYCSQYGRRYQAIWVHTSILEWSALPDYLITGNCLMW